MPREAIILLGVNHKTTPLAIREKLALSGGYDEPLHALGRITALKERFLLSTCNRMEVLYTCEAESVEEVREQVLDLLFANNVSRQELEQYVYTHQDSQAIEHLFTVASSLDSMIVGEAQILGQLKEAYRHATRNKSSGQVLNKLLHKSFSVAKRVRTETRIGANAVSISFAAVELAKKIFGSLDDKKVLLVGAGEMAELAAEHLVRQGVTQVIVANRTLQRAVLLARCYNGQAVAIEELIDQLRHVDIIISSTGATDLILEKEDVRSVMRGRHNRPLFFIDIAVPRDLDPGINDLDNVYLYDIDDLNNVVELNKTEREREALKARRIVQEETGTIQQWLEGRETIPTIVELRNRVSGLVEKEVARTMGRLPNLNPDEQQAIERMAASIANKILHHPMQYLRAEQHCSDRTERIGLVRALFHLDDNSRRCIK